MPQAIELLYNVSPISVWILFMVYNWLHSQINIYALLTALFSLDYRILLVLLNIAGLYMFLRHARIDFTLRVTMNNAE
jgi:hypothetical protein